MLDLKMFDKEITKYRELQTEIQKFEKLKCVTWLQINLKPINQALESWIAQWVMKFMNHVTDDSVQKLTDLQHFMAKANDGLAEEVADSDKEALMRAMGHVRDVRVVKTEIESMFNPLHSAIRMSVLLLSLGVGGQIEAIRETMERKLRMPRTCSRRARAVCECVTADNLPPLSVCVCLCE